MGGEGGGGRTGQDAGGESSGWQRCASQGVRVVCVCEWEARREEDECTTPYLYRRAKTTALCCGACGTQYAAHGHPCAACAMRTGVGGWNAAVRGRVWCRFWLHARAVTMAPSRLESQCVAPPCPAAMAPVSHTHSLPLARLVFVTDDDGDGDEGAPALLCLCVCVLGRWPGMCGVRRERVGAHHHHRAHTPAASGRAQVLALLGVPSDAPTMATQSMHATAAAVLRHCVGCVRVSPQNHLRHLHMHYRAAADSASCTEPAPGSGGQPAACTGLTAPFPLLKLLRATQQFGSSKRRAPPAPFRRCVASSALPARTPHHCAQDKRAFIWFLISLTRATLLLYCIHNCRSSLGLTGVRVTLWRGVASDVGGGGHLCPSLSLHLRLTAPHSHRTVPLWRHGLCSLQRPHPSRPPPCAGTRHRSAALAAVVGSSRQHANTRWQLYNNLAGAGAAARHLYERCCRCAGAYPFPGAGTSGCGAGGSRICCACTCPSGSSTRGASTCTCCTRACASSGASAGTC